MLELYKTECRRFRWWALIAGGIHAGLLLFYDRIIDLLQQPAPIYQLGGTIYAATGLLLGLYQTGSYARINQWIALLHRPFAPHRILAAVTGAGATMLTAAVLIPLLLLLATHGLTDGRFVDARHGLLIVSGALIALIGFLGGTYLILAPRRYGWLVLVAALLPAMSAAAGWAALAMQAAVIVVLALLVVSVFKPDRETPPHGGVALAGTALVLAAGAYRVIGLVGDFVFQALWIVGGTHPLNSTPPRGGIVEATRIEGGELLQAGLAGRTDRQALLWREQVRMSEAFELPIARMWLPARGELTNVAPLELDDRERGIHWTFSHDIMAFRGVRPADGRSVGRLDVAGGFQAPPLVLDGNRLIAGGGVYVFEPDDGKIHRRIRLPQGEVVVASPAAVGDAVAVLGSRALHFRDRRDLDSGEVTRAPIAEVPLPGPIGDLRRLDAIELLDGYLVSFTYGRNSIDGPAASWQRIVVVDGAGRARTVAERPLRPDFPLAARFRGYWVSPALQLLREATENAGAVAVAAADHAPIHVPRSIWIAATLLSLVAAALAAWLARRWRLGSRDGGPWTAASLVFGMPMLIAFWLIGPHRGYRGGGE
jgi:hypothetical protein